jgi:hypothetical protein
MNGLHTWPKKRIVGDRGFKHCRGCTIVPLSAGLVLVDDHSKDGHYCGTLPRADLTDSIRFTIPFETVLLQNGSL